jgi:spermidine synthase
MMTTMLLLRSSRSFFSPFSTVALRRRSRTQRSTPSPAAANVFFTSIFKRALYANRSEKDYLEYPNEEGEMLFSKSSDRSNGLVTVTKFGPHWRSLRFNDVEQGLAWVGEENERMDGKVLAYEYLRAMAAMTAAHRMLSSSSSDRDGMLMIGMGSGALPFFMQTHFHRAFEMETVEHDPVVIEAIERTCFNGGAMPFRCVVDDAREYLETKVASGSLDVISMDAFDGGGNVPEHLISREFFRLCGEKLRNHRRSSSNRRSMFIMNCFNGVRGSTAREFVHVICARLEKSIGPVMTIPVHDQPCNVIVVALKRSSEEEEEGEDIRAQYSREAIAQSARAAFKEGNAKEWDAGERVEGLFWVVDCDEKEKTMREIEPNTTSDEKKNQNKKNREGKYRGRNGTYMPKEFAENVEVYEGQITDAHSYENDEEKGV